MNNTCVTTATCVDGWVVVNIRLLLKLYTIFSYKNLSKRPEDITIGVGKWDLSRDDAPRPAQVLKAKFIAIDPNYNGADGQNDIALIGLADEVKLDYYIEPICLDVEQAIPTSDYERRCVITGWGANAKASKSKLLFFLLKTNSHFSPSPFLNSRWNSSLDWRRPPLVW